MLASGLWDNHTWWGLIPDFAGLMCFACNLCMLSAFAPSSPSLSLVTVSIWGGMYMYLH